MANLCFLCNNLYMTIDDEFYKRKMFKYKTKYLNMKGGSIRILKNGDMFSLPNRIQEIDGYVNYKIVEHSANKYNQTQIDDLNLFIYHVLPYCLQENKKLDIIDKLEMLSAGAYGTTLFYNNTVTIIMD